MKISKRIMALLMAALLVFGLPLSAFASDGGEIRICLLYTSDAADE